MYVPMAFICIGGREGGWEGVGMEKRAGRRETRREKGKEGGREGEGEGFRMVIVILQGTTTYSSLHHVFVCHCSQQNIIICFR